MPFSATNVSVSATAVLLVDPAGGNVGDPVPVVIINNDAAATLFIGGTGVTTVNGLPIYKQSGVSFRLLQGEPVFGIASAGPLDIRVLIGRQ